MSNRFTAAALAFVQAACLAACAKSGGGASLSPQTFARRAAASGPIQHVVIVMQENRSFDNLFQGYPGADTRPYGYDSHGHKVKLRPVSLAAPYGLDHSSPQFFADYDNGKMDGFDSEPAGGPHPKYPAYGYVPSTEIKPYLAMAKQYVLGDRMFTSHLDASFVSHQYIIAGQAQHSVDLPTVAWGCSGTQGDQVGTLLEDRAYGPDQTPCFDYRTLGDELDEAGLSWRYYAVDKTDIWSAYQAVAHIYNGPDWQNVISPNTQFINDVAAGTLANVTWVMPSCPTSDHAGCASTAGPKWVASIVDAVGNSPFWNSTAIFVLWDEWGGWYDHVPPPILDYDGLGIRVPLLVVSPYAKRGYVSHVRYEHGSILRFAEDQFGLGRLAPSDGRANSPATDCFDFAAPPRPFRKIQGGLTPAELRSAAADRRPADDD